MGNVGPLPSVCGCLIFHRQCKNRTKDSTSTLRLRWLPLQGLGTRSTSYGRAGSLRGELSATMNFLSQIDVFSTRSNPLSLQDLQRSNLLSCCTVTSLKMMLEECPLELVHTGTAGVSRPPVLRRTTERGALASSTRARSKTPRCLQVPLVSLRSRGHGFAVEMEDVRSFMPGDFSSGKGAKHRGLAKKGLYCHDNQVSEFGRDAAINRFATMLDSGPILKSALWSMSGQRLICHHMASQRFHGADIMKTCK